MAATPDNAAPLKPLHGTPLVLLTIAVAFSTFMEVLDMTIVNVAVPHISGSLGVSASEGTWTISSYSLASAIMQPLTGWIARRFGEVRTFVISVALFVVFSMLCGMATSMPMLVYRPPDARRGLRPDGGAVADAAAVQLSKGTSKASRSRYGR